MWGRFCMFLKDLIVSFSSLRIFLISKRDRFLNFPVSRRFHYYNVIYITLQAFLSKTRQRYDHWDSLGVRTPQAWWSGKDRFVRSIATWQILMPRDTITWVRDQMILPPVKIFRFGPEILFYTHFWDPNSRKNFSTPKKFIFKNRF